ncbi:MAG: hypothetical protein IKW99_01825 [Bacteroidales bacterium]|nr:hypothetical protein [Bacteroidales bacterium]
MRRLFIPVICVVCALALVSCGGKGAKKAENAGDDGKVDIEKVAKKLEQEAFEGEKYSKEAAEFYFKKNEGIKLSDLAPEYKLNETSKYTYYGDERDVLANFKIQDGDTYTKEQHIDNVRRIYALTKKVADNGINVYGFEEKSNKDEAYSEKDLEQMIKDNNGTKIMGVEIYLGDYGWSFVKDGALHRCEIDLLEKNDVKLGYSVKMYKGLQKSMDETMKEAEEMLSDPEVQKQVEKALKDAAK